MWYCMQVLVLQVFLWYDGFQLKLKYAAQNRIRPYKGVVVNDCSSSSFFITNTVCFHKKAELLILFSRH
jgi:hypothetical protein